MSDEVKTCNSCKRVFQNSEDYLNNTSRWRLCSRKNLWFNCKCGSTLLVLQGKYDWYSPTSLLSDKAKSIFNKMILFGELPYIPSSVMEIQTELQSPDFDIFRVARILKGEPFIATNILIMANNIKSNRDPHDRTKIDKIEHAVTYLGKKSTAEVVLTAGVKSLVVKTSVFKSDLFWEESLLIGGIAEFLCEKFQVKFSRDEVYLGASLCNIGKFVLAFFMPDTLDRIVERLQSPKQLSTWRDAEGAVGAPDHSILGEIGCAFWGLPMYVSDACRFHHEQSQVRPSGFQGILPGEIIALANQFAHWVLLRPERIDQIHFEKLRVAVGLSKKDIDDLGLSLSKLVKRQRA